MNEDTHAVLIATATAEVIKQFVSFVDLDAAWSNGRAQMEAMAKSLGLPAGHGRKLYEENYEAFKDELLSFFEEQAKIEINKAVSEAEAEQRTHSQLLDEFRSHHSNTMKMLNDRHEHAVPDGADDDFVQLINSSHEDMVQAAERFHRDFMSIFQMRHRLNLEHCFTGHHVGNETAKALVELYEIK